MKLHQRTIKTAAMFSILLFLVLSITMTLSTAFAVLLFRIGFWILSIFCGAVRYPNGQHRHWNNFV